MIEIYTDGSKTDLGTSVGSAVYIPKLNIEIKKSLPKYSSIYTAECYAIFEALKFATKNKNNSYIVYTDSLSVLETLNIQKLDIKTNFYILEIKEMLKKFDNKSMQLIWVPAHKGIKGNEKADEMAKQATVNKSDNILIPYTDFYAFFKKKFTNSNNEKIQKDGEYKGKTYFKNYYKNTAKPWFIDSSLSRKYITTVNRLRSDHYSLNASLFKIKVVDNSSCTCGYEIQCINHIIFQCEIYDEQRKKLYNELSKFRMFPPFDINIFISDPKSIMMKKIFLFLQNCNLNI